MLRANTYFSALLFFFAINASIGQIVITEVMYNPPESGTDSLEYIELYNTTDSPIDMSEYTISDGVEYTFGNTVIGAGEYLVVARNAAALSSIFNVDALEWSDGALSNGGETLEISDEAGNVIDVVDYDDDAPWPEDADGDGYAMELCAPDRDNNDGFNWRLSSNATGMSIDGVELFGSPGMANDSACDAQAELNDIIVTEIYYDDPTNDDELAFFEILNRSNKVLNITDWVIDGDVSLTIPSDTIFPNELRVYSGDEDALEDVFDASSTEWESGDLDNEEGTIRISDTEGNVIHLTNYFTSLPWPTDANGTGQSIELCDRDGVIEDGLQWQASSVLETVSFGDEVLRATPGELGACLVNVMDITENDDNGRNTSVGRSVRLRGVLYGNNLREEGLEFTLNDINNDGISIVNLDDDFGLELSEADQVILEGTVDQFNGQSQIRIDTIALENNNALLNLPNEVNNIGEDDESQLIRIVDCTLVNPNAWGGIGNGFVVQITNGQDTFDMWIDDQVDLFDLGYPSGEFDVIGIGRQFDTSSPYDDGYQIAPRYKEDITPFDPVEIEAPSYSIGLVTTENENGVADSLDVECRLTGVVHGINFRPSGLSFTIIDDEHDGIVVFSDSETLGYSVQEADLVEVTGFITQFQGLTEIIPSEIEFISFENGLRIPILVDSLSEASESKLVRLNNLTLSDAEDWVGDGSSFNVTVEDADGRTHIIRIDNDNELSTAPAPMEPFDVIGLGGQFDPSEPFTSGYQLFPRYANDIIPRTVATVDQTLERTVMLMPNPAADVLNIDGSQTIQKVVLHDQKGQKVLESKDTEKINLDRIPSGIYNVSIYTSNGIISKKLIKQ